ncbi:hypothetical protein KSE_69610 [Kitasatospora setae KM-6054]|uniref:Uncharacterized protein n=1 Tax=Kitasatospora setae (strain ATCC 33774 / DSM 43861 / JCM 3304 / KCC A-0304 / NBRC 14216 / KM-6054) TaxID=452652 RepID=E4N3I5_KITSK|nr:hypothetical protein KSE_69610 [Kitasatospora setae KM-6054]
MIAPAGADASELAAAVRGLQPLPGSLIVVAAAPDSAAVLRDRMADLGLLARARGVSTLVLAASGLAALAPNGRRPAEVVAERAELPVIAPDGLVEISPDGELDVVAPEGSSAPVSWWYCAPGAAPRRARRAARSAMAPPPAITPAAGSAFAPVPARPPAPVEVRRLPAGYWLTHAAAPPREPLPGLGLAAAPPGTTVLVVGTPACPVLLPEDFADTVTALPVDPARLLVSAPWAAPDELAALTGTLAGRLARPVQAAIGLPVLGPDGPTSRILDARGQAHWEPYLLRLKAAPGRPTAPWAWRKGPADWRTDGPAVFEAFPYWALEAVPAGLWLRPEPPHVLTPRFRRPEPARPLLIVGERDRPVAADVFEELGNLLDRLPTTGSEGFGLLVHGLLEPDTVPVARFVARLHDLDWLGPEQPTTAPPAPAPVWYGSPAATPAPPPQPLSAQPLAAQPVSAPTATESLAPAVETAPTPTPVSPQPFPAPALTPPTRLATSGGPDTTTTATPAPATAAATATWPPSEPEPAPAPTPRPVPVPVPEPASAAEPTDEPAAEPEHEQAPPLPTHPDEPSARPVPTALRYHRFRPEEVPVPPATSDAADRDAVRALLGEYYHRCAGRVEQVSTRLPALRSTARDDIKPDLAAVLMHHGDTGVPADRAGLVAAARGGDPELAPFLRCLGSGLRRLPSHHGAVLLGAPGGTDPVALLAEYAVGRVLVEPGPVTGLSATVAELPYTPVEFVVWSATGRRTAAFAAGTDEPQVVFAPGTSFTVLAVLPNDSDGDDVPSRVLLRESTDPEGADPAARDRAALTRLRAWLDRRARIDPADRRTVDRPERFHLTPGVAPLPEPAAT